MRAPRILIADDQRDVLESLRLLLKGEGYVGETFDTPATLIEALRTRAADAVLMDLNYTRDTTSGDEGLDMIARIRSFDAHTPIVVMTAWGSIELAVEAMRRGAQDFIEKPWDNDRLITLLRTQVALGQALNRARALEAANRQLVAASGELIAESPAMQPVLETIERVAPTDANVLITGESGCGKGLVARIIHERSNRSNASFVVVNIGSLAETVFESEMFGHVRGAFTDAKSDRVGRFELADGGTLFLDEIANIPVAQQARLLRVLEDGEFERLGSSRTQQTDVRVLAATNSDIQAEIEAGRFRNDLLYRLNTIHIDLPPLRARGDDMIRLAQHFLDVHSRRHRKSIASFTDAALSALRRYAWPGNVRELNHVVERAVLMSRRAVIEPKDLRLEILQPAAADRGGMTLEEIERDAIRASLVRHDGNVIAAAPALLAAALLLWNTETALSLRIAALSLIALSALIGALHLRGLVVRPLQSLANMLEALREGDYSMRGRNVDPEDALGEVMIEVNSLSRTLYDQRLEALEAGMLLQKVIADVDIAVFAFDAKRRLRIVNRAGAQLLGGDRETLRGRSAEELGLLPMLQGSSGRIVSHVFPGGGGRWEVRRRILHEGGRPHDLLVITDVSRALREEERLAWQRLVRVIGHELNSSLAPIKSMAGTLHKLLGRDPLPVDWRDDAEHGLEIIHDRAEALGRFMGAYARLAKLPPPTRAATDFAPLVRHAAALYGDRVTVETRDDVSLNIDGDQIEQVLINLIKNAVEAVGGKGDVRVRWKAANGRVQLQIEDDGPGLARTDNLWVPFFTTKPNGTGLGLVLSRDIVENHGGTITLANRRGKRGCIATVGLPLG